MVDARWGGGSLYRSMGGSEPRYPKALIMLNGAIVLQSAPQGNGKRRLAHQPDGGGQIAVPLLEMSAGRPHRLTLYQE